MILRCDVRIIRRRSMVNGKDQNISNTRAMSENTVLALCGVPSLPNWRLHMVVSIYMPFHG